MPRLTGSLMYALTILALFPGHTAFAAIVLFLGVDLGALIGVIVALAFAVKYGFTFYSGLAIVHAAFLAVALAASLLADPKP